MQIVSTESIVVKTQDLGEGDRLVTFLTRDMGRVKGVVKGSRKLTSRGVGNFEPFSRGVMFFSRRTGSDLVSIRKMDPLPPYLYLQASYNKIVYAGYLAELAGVSPWADEESGRFFDLLLEALDAICAAPRERHLPLIRMRFEIRLLELLGLQPDWNTCQECERELPAVGEGKPGATASGEYVLDVSRGGMLCPDCHAGPRKTTAGQVIRAALPGQALAFLAGWRQGGSMADLKPSQPTLEALQEAVTAHVIHHLERTPRALALLPALEELEGSAQPSPPGEDKPPE
ncbi:MAG: DNA repair protein RecO [Deltaproteobacteria bacterium]|nr:DNA repair protein RecO [Deltaproteobacteria bacterium]